MTDFQWALVEANLDPVIGNEQQGKRPVLIVSNEEFNQVIANVTVLPLTASKRRLYPSEVLLPAGQAGQSHTSIIMAHQIRTISRHRLGGLIGYLNDVELKEQVRQAIKEHLDLD